MGLAMGYAFFVCPGEGGLTYSLPALRLIFFVALSMRGSGLEWEALDLARFLETQANKTQRRRRLFMLVSWQ